MNPRNLSPILKIHLSESSAHFLAGPICPGFSEVHSHQFMVPMVVVKQDLVQFLDC